MFAFAAAASAGIAACSSEGRYGVLTFLFGDDIPRSEQDTEPAPVVRSPRRSQQTPTPSPTPAQGGQRQPTFSSWNDAASRLPKDQAGNPDWVGAVEQRVISPRPGIAADSSETEVLDLDVDLAPKSNPAFKVTFSHRRHGTWLACVNCHEDLFPMQAAALPDGNAAHGERYCGACHGKVAFDVANGCPLCHLQTLPRDSSGYVDWNRALSENLIAPLPARTGKSSEVRVLDLDVTMTPEGQPNLKGVFSHATHTQWLSCENCHPRPFATQAGKASQSGADLHSREYCGACHGSVAFGITRGCERCHPALKEGKQHREVLDLDNRVASKSDPSQTTIFSHRIHTPWVECSICHGSLFEKTAAAQKMTTAEIQSGQYCAQCHGKVASDLIRRCRPCHPSEEAK